MEADEKFSALPFPEKVQYQFTDARGMEGLADLGGKSETRNWFQVSRTAGTSSYALHTAQVAEK